MKVKVVFTIETEDFGREEFKNEIKTLIEEIDLNTKLLDFDMYEIKNGRRVKNV